MIYICTYLSGNASKYNIIQLYMLCMFVLVLGNVFAMHKDGKPGQIGLKATDGVTNRVQTVRVTGDNNKLATTNWQQQQQIVQLNKCFLSLLKCQKILKRFYVACASSAKGISSMR